MIFAREISDTLTSLVKKIDAATAENKGCDMGSFVVFCSDDESLEKRLKDLADKEKISKLVLTIDNPSGPTKYKIAKDADVTVVLYTKGAVKANYAFKKGELKSADVDKIVGAIEKILPSKK
jgi:siroheme synthase (precorrin-2 oxidase/ferrochelatase)